jgi:Flp pilus assembly protein TadD
MTTPSGFSASSRTERLLATAKQLIDAQRFAEAIAPMSEAATLQPDNARLLTDLGRLYLETGQPAPDARSTKRDRALPVGHGSAKPQ